MTLAADRAGGPPYEGCATATSGRYRVIERRAFGRYTLLTLLAPEVAAVAQPGQFVMVAVPGSGFHLRRPLSLHSAEGERVRVLVEPRGEGSRALAAAGVADRLDVAGPLGVGFPLDGLASALVVGGGIGVAPFQAVADRLRARRVPLTAVFGFRDEDQARLAGAFEIDDLYLATDDGSVGRHGTAVDLAREVGAGPQARGAACGPAPMLRAVRAWAAEAGLRGYASLEAHMACGTGACHGCVVPTTQGYLRVCVDGPVFPLETLTDESPSSPDVADDDEPAGTASGTPAEGAPS